MSLIQRARQISRVLLQSEARFDSLSRQFDELKLLAAEPLVRDIRIGHPLQNIQDAEFKVFSQFGDDGIIQYLIHVLKLPAEEQSFIEFGVENYRESNTRFLLFHDNWRGLIMDGSSEYMTAVRAEEMYWRHDLKAVGAFITRENINGILRDNGFGGRIGILSIDIDGNDYWVWKEISQVDAAIVIVEYNSVFGPHHAITVPYEPAFRRGQAHSSNLYWGVSLRALSVLAEQKGYVLVGCNSAGNNAYFVKKDRLNSLKPLTVEQAYVESRFRESRDIDGNLTFVGGADRLKVIADMQVFDVLADRTVTIRSIEA